MAEKVTAGREALALLVLSSPRSAAEHLLG